MKKLLLIGAATLFMGACTGLNKNTVAYHTAKYDTAKYYVVAGEGASKEQASQNALDNLSRDLAQNAPAANEQGILTDLVANASVDKVWRDKDAGNKHFYALAVLSRKNAQKVLEPQMDQADAQLEGLAAQFSSTSDPLADLRVAYRMQPVVTRRNALDEAYQFLSADRHHYNTEKFQPYKNVLKEKLSAVLVGVDVQGQESKVMTTYIVDALNQMGLGVVDLSEPEKTLSVEVMTDIDGYNSQKVKGLIWCSSTAAISLIDHTRGGVTFARFNVYERAGTSRASDSKRRSMESAGEQAAKQIMARLEAYLKTR